MSRTDTLGAQQAKVRGAPHAPPHPSLKPEDAVDRSFGIRWAPFEGDSGGHCCWARQVLISLAKSISACSGPRPAATPGLPTSPQHRYGEAEIQEWWAPPEVHQQRAPVSTSSEL